MTVEIPLSQYEPFFDTVAMVVAFLISFAMLAGGIALFVLGLREPSMEDDPLSDRRTLTHVGVFIAVWGLIFSLYCLIGYGVIAFT